MLDDRKVDVACVQETRWMGLSCSFFSTVGKRYKLFGLDVRRKLKV